MLIGKERRPKTQIFHSTIRFRVILISTLEQFERFAAKARLPSKLTLDTVRETVMRFAEVWRNPPAGIIDDRIRAAIERHIRSVPIWNPKP